MALKKSELYSSLWSSCDELRGGMDASQYKDYVLVLLFIKYVSDKYAGMPYAPITIPVGSSFKDMVALKGKPDIGDQINKKIIGPLSNANKLSDMPDFNDANKLGSGKEMVERLTNLIAIFENKALDFSKNRAEGDDILGDAYEYLMRHFATESGKSKGQFYTPAEVSRVIAQIIGIREATTTSDTTVYDPTCGSGSLLLKVADEASTRVTLYGQEKDAATSGLARMNMILHNNATALIVQGNTLADPRFKDGDTLKTFDYVVANPPFSDKRWSTGVSPLQDPYERFKPFGTPPGKQGDYAYLLHIVRSLKSTGKGACILPHGVLFRGNAEGDIRRNLVRKGYIKGIIGLPANLFYGTGIPACIIVVDKQDAHARKGIFMIDASAGFMKDGPKNRLRAQDIHKIVDIFNKRLEVPKYSRMVSFDEIEKNEFNLNLPRKGLNDWQKDELKKKWGTMQIVLSSRSRMERVVSDIIFDFSVKPRLSSERGNAILVASSIYEACKYFALFQKTPFKGKCAVVTSYNPQARDVSKEEIGVNTETDKQFIFNTYTELLKDVEPKPGMTKTETYEEWAKSLFTEQPANMKLLVVVDKLLTGFDAPPCTYLHIDKSMQDHGLFQAICRVNRLDGDDKDFGYIVDYKDLFKKVENAIAVYTSELDRSAGGVDPEVLLQDRVKKGRERLDSALEALKLLCEPVKPPQGEYEHIRYFCGNTEIPTDLQEHEPQRSALYKATATLVRSYANIADELEPAGYTGDEIAHIKKQVQHYLDVREIVRKASGESLDLKPYEADMRHLIDTYIEADEPRKISPFDDMGLLDLIVKTGIADAIAQELGGLKGNKDAISETIENNVRSKIIKEHLTDPAYYEKMSALLDEIIAARKANAIQYEEYLKRVAELAKRVEAGQAEETPKTLNTPGRRALYNNLNHDEGLALKLDEAVRTARPDGWRGVQAREQVVKKALYDVLQDVSEVERIFLIIKAQREY